MSPPYINPFSFWHLVLLLFKAFFTYMGWEDDTGSWLGFSIFQHIEFSLFIFILEIDIIDRSYERGEWITITTSTEMPFPYYYGY